MLSEDSHLNDELLLMELDGELSPQAAASVRAHLDACWRCRARRQELERSIADFIQVYQQEFDRRLPPAAGPRALLKANLAQYSAEAKQPRRWFAPWHKPASAATICVLSVFIIGWIATRGQWPMRKLIPRTDRSYGVDDLAISTPDTTLTPGATILLTRSAVCSQENVKNKDVPVSIQRMVFREYGLAKAQPRAYEVDYLVTPALGGSDDIRNLWPHSYSSLWNARVKDALEDRLRDMVCDGELELADAQREIAGNWIEAYKKYFHTDHPLPEHTNR
jgi:hypothetical protein